MLISNNKKKYVEVSQLRIDALWDVVVLLRNRRDITDKVNDSNFLFVMEPDYVKGHFDEKNLEIDVIRERLISQAGNRVAEKLGFK